MGDKSRKKENSNLYILYLVANHQETDYTYILFLEELLL